MSTTYRNVWVTSHEYSFKNWTYCTHWRSNENKLLIFSFFRVSSLQNSSSVILFTVCYAIHMLIVRRIVFGSTINPLIDIFLYSHHMSNWNCFDMVRRNPVLVTHGSLRLGEGSRRMNLWSNIIVLKMVS